MSNEEIRLEVAKLAIQCFIGCNGNRNFNDFRANAAILYDYIKFGKLPKDAVKSKE